MNGGKGKIYQNIINLIPPHETFISAFLGNCAIMRNKLPALRNIGLDLNIDTLNKFKCDPVSLNMQIPGSIGKCSDISGNIIKNNDIGQTSQLASINNNIELYKIDALKYLSEFKFKGNEFIYCDPPYLMETRSTKRKYYKYEMLSEKEHIKLLKLIKTLNCKIMISGYYSELYMNELDNWNYKYFNSITRSGKIAKEYIWYNYNDPVKLHDYRYLGNNFRERERIKRKKNRWLERLKKMDVLERQAIFSAIEILQ